MKFRATVIIKGQTEENKPTKEKGLAQDGKKLEGQLTHQSEDTPEGE